MADRLTKRQVEELLRHVDGPSRQLIAALDRAVGTVHDGLTAAARLRAVGRTAEADRLDAGDRATAWALATELNEQRHL